MRNRQRLLVLATFPLCACATFVPPTPAPAPAHTSRYQLQAVTALAPASLAADSQLALNPVANVADGNLATAWANGGFQAATAWVQLAFAGDTQLSTVGLRMPPAAAGTSYDLQVSTDGSTWVTALAAQASASWSLETKLLPPATHGSFLRMLWHNSASAPQPHVNVYELTATGTPAGAPAPGPVVTPVPVPNPVQFPIPNPVPVPVYPLAADPGAHAAAGLVYNNGAPVAGISIALVKAGGGSTPTTTDAHGHYQVSGLADGVYQAFYYNPSDRNKIGYWRSRPLTVGATSGAAFPTVDLYLPGQINKPLPNTRVKLPAILQWLGPIQPVVGYYYRVHSEPFTAFQLVFQSVKLPGTTASYDWDGKGTLTGPLDPNHRYFWGVQWDWGPLGQGGNLYQAAMFTP